MGIVTRIADFFARANGTGKLIGLLKDAGNYPKSDLDREAVA